MLQNAYFLAKIGADTARKEQHFAEILPIGRRVAGRRQTRRAAGTSPGCRRLHRRVHGAEYAEAGEIGPKCIFEKCIFENFRKFCIFSAGSFSAVSKRIFARKYAFSIFQALQDLHPFAPLQSQNFRQKIGLKKQQFS